MSKRLTLASEEMTPPTGSRIQIETDHGYQKIVIPHGRRGIKHLFGTAFLIVWLGGWAFGWYAAVASLLKDGVHPFLLLWLSFWTFFGVFAISELIHSLRPIPETLLLHFRSLIHDPGTPFVDAFDYRSRKNPWKTMFRRRKKTEFSPQDLQTLRLREFVGGNRLTVDKDTARIDLGTCLNEIEREWLYSFLAHKYEVPPKPPSPFSY